MSLRLLTPLPAGAALPAARSRAEQMTHQAVLALAASLFVALCAHIAVPLPFTPVPFTLQPFAVLLVGMMLSPGLAFSAMLLYLLQGAAGLPVFTPLGLPGVARLAGPTGGYLLAYPFAAALASALPQLFRLPRRFVAYACSGLAAMSLIYLSGACWFSFSMHLSFTSTLAATATPFAASDAVKICAAAGIASALKAGGNSSRLFAKNEPATSSYEHQD